MLPAGGEFTSRLFKSIRQDRGIAYGAHTEVWYYGPASLWLARSPVETAKTREALEVFVKKPRGLGGERPVTAEELSIAQECDVERVSFRDPAGPFHR